MLVEGPKENYTPVSTQLINLIDHVIYSNNILLRPLYIVLEYRKR